MASIWAVAKALRYPLDRKLENINYMPYTISFVIRKRMQVESYNELPREKRPPEKLIWDGKKKDIDKWFDKVFDTKKSNQVDGIIIDINDVE